MNDNQYTTPQEELVQDLIMIIAHFSGKLHGLRSHESKKMIKTVKDVINADDDDS